MNTKVLLLALSFLPGFCTMQNCFAEANIQVEKSNQSVILDMQNMSCAICGITIRKALQGVDGVQTVKVDFDSKTASITFNPEQTNIETLIKATTNAGYPATVRPEK